jgi:hypothetical protein
MQQTSGWRTHFKEKWVVEETGVILECVSKWRQNAAFFG